MSEVDTTPPPAAGAAALPLPRHRLGELRLVELRAIAASLGLAHVSTLRKGPLVDAITNATTDDQAAAAAPEVDDAVAPEGADTDVADTDVADTDGAVPTADEQAGGADTDALPVTPPEEQPSSPAAEDAAPAAEPESEPETGGAIDDAGQPAVAELVEPSEDLAADAELVEPNPDASVIAAAISDAAPEDDSSAAAAAEIAEPSGADRPRSARDHTNQGLTGIAEDLQQLQRRETGAVPVEGQHDGTVPSDTADAETPATDEAPAQPEPGEGRRGRGRGRGRGQGQGDRQQQGDRAQNDRAQNDRQQQGERQQDGDRQQTQARTQTEAEPVTESPKQDGAKQDGRQQDGRAQDGRQQQDGEGRGRNRYRDRKRRGQGADTDEPEISDDDVLVPIAGILDVLDNYAFVRTSGYLAGPNDVYVSLGQVKKYALRKGDAVVGAIRQVREGESSGRQKYNALVRVDSINGLPVGEAESRVEFERLTALYPQERLRLETESQKYGGRIVDLIAPIGKGQRGLVVAPPKSGKTLILQTIAEAITKNNPEVHLMVVLVDERPEEVTEMQRTVKGEVIASTFDRPAEDHTTVAELAVERAKRLVELGYDVVVLLDSITRLGRAYNQVVPASGRTLAGGVDPAALHPAKQVFGAARNIENGGSLTIIATALVETGSAVDETIFDEFKGTGNMELRLSRDLADKRVFPSVDVAASSTRREELLMGPDEVKVTWQLRRALAGLDTLAALEVVLNKLRETGSNVEFLVQMQKSLPRTAGA